MRRPKADAGGSSRSSYLAVGIRGVNAVLQDIRSVPVRSTIVQAERRILSCMASTMRSAYRSKQRLIF
ncbi:hypothetical protein PM082_007340 [Marasmius tenuissimus]|nr:hypothetical protein PM082_007340 [Marasmius tenuissimus]